MTLPRDYAILCPSCHTWACSAGCTECCGVGTIRLSDYEVQIEAAALHRLSLDIETWWNDASSVMNEKRKCTLVAHAVRQRAERMIDALQKRKAEAVHARQAPKDSQEMGQEVRGEGEKEQKAFVVDAYVPHQELEEALNARHEEKLTLKALFHCKCTEGNDACTLIWANKEAECAGEPTI